MNTFWSVLLFDIVFLIIIEICVMQNVEEMEFDFENVGRSGFSLEKCHNHEKAKFLGIFLLLWIGFY